MARLGYTILVLLTGLLACSGTQATTVDHAPELRWVYFRPSPPRDALFIHALHGRIEGTTVKVAAYHQTIVAHHRARGRWVVNPETARGSARWLRRVRRDIEHGAAHIRGRMENENGTATDRARVPEFEKRAYFHDTGQARFMCKMQGCVHSPVSSRSHSQR